VLEPAFDCFIDLLAVHHVVYQLLCNMRVSATLPLSAIVLPASAVAIGNARRSAVMHFVGDDPLTQGLSDPIADRGHASMRANIVMGGNAFSNSVTGQELLAKSTCTTAELQADKSAYWMPNLYFHDRINGTFEAVKMYYMSVHYL